MIRWAAIVRRSGEPGPAPTRVIRPPLEGWIDGGRFASRFRGTTATATPSSSFGGGGGGGDDDDDEDEDDDDDDDAPPMPRGG